MQHSLETLAARIQELEDREEIRELKARYCRALDLRRLDDLRATLLPEAVVAYEGFPVFESRDAFVAVFEQMGCAPGVYDIHHALNAELAFTAPDEATGKWSLHFKSIILAQRSIITLGVEYTDRYVRRDGKWFIAETRTTRPLCLIEAIDEAGRATYVALGAPPQTYG